MINVDINHPSFIALIEKVNAMILQNISVDKYFSLSEDKKRGLSYLSLKLVNNSMKSKVKLTDNELLSFITILWKRNEEFENYELAAVMKNIMENFTTIYKSIQPKPRTRKIAIK
jgi:hypothetical protein